MLKRDVKLQLTNFNHRVSVSNQARDDAHRRLAITAQLQRAAVDAAASILTSVADRDRPSVGARRLIAISVVVATASSTRHSATCERTAERCRFKATFAHARETDH